MSIRIGIYDFFARVIPGGLCLAAFLYILIRYFSFSINFTKLATTQLIILGAIAYIIGFVLTPISGFLYRCFQPKNLYKKTIEQLSQELPAVEICYKNMDWGVLLSFIKRHNMDMGLDVEHLNAVSIMLRNASLCTLLFSIIFCFEFIFINRLPSLILFCNVCFICAILLLRESIKFRTWFYRAIHQSVIALIANPEDLAVKFKSGQTLDKSN